MLRAQLTVQPRFREAPFAFHGARRSTDQTRGLFHGEAGEEPQLDDPHLFRIEGGQPFERLVDRQDVGDPRIVRGVSGCPERYERRRARLSLSARKPPYGNARRDHIA